MDTGEGHRQLQWVRVGRVPARGGSPCRVSTRAKGKDKEDKCGQTHHFFHAKRDGVRTTHVNSVQESSEERFNEVDVDAAWIIGVLDADWKMPRQPTRNTAWTPATGSSLTDKNCYTVLNEHEEDMDGGDCDEVFVVEGTKGPWCCNPSPTRARMGSMRFHVARVQRLNGLRSCRVATASAWGRMWTW